MCISILYCSMLFCFRHIYITDKKKALHHVCPSVRIQGTDWLLQDAICGLCAVCLGVQPKFVCTFQFWLPWDKNDRHFTQRPMYVCDQQSCLVFIIETHCLLCRVWMEDEKILSIKHQAQFIVNVKYWHLRDTDYESPEVQYLDDAQL